MKKLVLVAGVAAALVLSACGASTPAARKATLDGYVASLGAAPYLQVGLSATAAGPGTAKTEAVLKDLGVTLNFSSADGSALSSSAKNVNEEIIVTIKGTTLVDLREVSSNIYFNLNASEISNIPGVSVSPSELAGIQLVFGGRWFELQKSTLNSMVPKKESSSAKAAEDSALFAKIIDDVTTVIDTTPYKSEGGGKYTETGTLYSIAHAVYPTIKSLGSVSVPTASSVPGSYTLGVTTAGANAAGASISITDPTASTGDVTGTLSATFAHANTTVTAPSNATKVTKQLLDGFFAGSSASSSSTSSTTTTTSSF